MSPVPNIQSSPAYAAQAVPDASDWQNITQGFSVTGLISGCVVTPYGSPAMGVAVSAGSVACSGVITRVTAASVTIQTASTSDRRDMIVANSGGSVFAVAGVPCGTANWTAETFPGYPPVKASIPNNCAFLAEVYVAATTTSITSPLIELSGTQLFVTSQYVTTFNNRTGQIILGQSDVDLTFTAAGQIPVGTGANTGEYLAVGSVGTVLTSLGSGSVPAWRVPTGSGAASAGVQSFNGRFGVVSFTASDAESVFTTPGQIMVGTGSGAGELLTAGSVGTVLTSNGAASIPSWQVSTGSGSVNALAIEKTFTTAGQIYVGSGAGTGLQLGAGSVGTVLTSQGPSQPLIWAPSSASVGVTSFNSRSGSVTPQTGDYSVGQVTGAAPLASPTFTGVPTAATASVGTGTLQLATCQFVGFTLAFYGALTPWANITTNTQSASVYTPVSTDFGKIIEMTSASVCAINLNTGVFSTGQQYQVCQAGFGAVTFVAGGGFTLDSYYTGLTTLGQWANVWVRYRSASEAVITGDLW